MLFLLNRRVFDLDSPDVTLQALVSARDFHRLVNLPSSGAVQAGRDLFFKTPDGQEPALKAQKILACLLAIKTEADAALFVRPPDATHSHEVGARLGAAPLTTLAYLLSLQESNNLTARTINEWVWDLAESDQTEDA